MQTINLVLIPGFLGQSSDFDNVIDYLPKNINSHVFTPFANELEVECFEDAVKQWSENCKFEYGAPTVVLGYSLGGRIAMALAQHWLAIAPDNIKGLIIESAHPGLKSYSEKQSRIQHDLIWSERFASESVAVVLKDWYRQSVFSSLSMAQVEELVQYKAHMDGAQMAQQLKNYSLGRQTDYRDFLENISVPVLYISGGQDQKYNALGHSLKNIEHKEASACGHNVHFEAPQWFAKTIETFILERVITP